MSFTSLLRALPRALPSACAVRSAAFPRQAAFPAARAVAAFSSSSRALSKDSADASAETGSHGHEESFEEFSARFEKEFEQVQDVFELQRNLNNAFAYDLVPAPSVIVAALKAARRVNDFPTAVRVFEGIKAKVENKGQYEQYLEELAPLRKELGIELKEDLYPEEN